MKQPTKARVVKQWHTKALRFVYYVEIFNPDWNGWNAPGDEFDDDVPYDTQAEAAAAAKSFLEAGATPRYVVVEEINK